MHYFIWTEQAFVNNIHVLLLSPHFRLVQFSFFFFFFFWYIAVYLPEPQLLKNLTENFLISQQNNNHNNQWNHCMITQVNFSEIQSHLDIMFHESSQCKSNKNNKTALTSGLWFQLRPN